MNKPVEEVPFVIRALTQSSPDTQQHAIDTYFTKDARFIHPFCRTGSFDNSRWLIGRIFRWYKIMSPQIELTVNSIAYDEKKLRLYVDISQVFRIWLVPFYSAHVNLVTVLDLTYDHQQKVYRINSQNDLYQFNEWLKFISPFKGVILQVIQFFATLACVICATIFSPLALLQERSIASRLVNSET